MTFEGPQAWVAPREISASLPVLGCVEGRVDGVSGHPWRIQQGIQLPGHMRLLTLLPTKRTQALCYEKVSVVGANEGQAGACGEKGALFVGLPGSRLNCAPVGVGSPPTWWGMQGTQGSQRSGLCPGPFEAVLGQLLSTVSAGSQRGLVGPVRICAVEAPPEQHREGETPGSVQAEAYAGRGARAAGPPGSDPDWAPSGGESPPMCWGGQGSRRSCPGPRPSGTASGRPPSTALVGSHWGLVGPAQSCMATTPSEAADGGKNSRLLGPGGSWLKVPMWMAADPPSRQASGCCGDAAAA